MSHTPGPWMRNIRAKGRYPTVFAGPQGAHVHVAHVCQAATPEETEANIDLVSAAPDLLAALRDFHPSKITSQGDMARAWEAARAIIAKAEGRS